MTGYERDTARVLVAGINVILNILLVPQFGIEGAAVSTATAVVTLNIILTRKVRARLRIEPSISGPTFKE